MTRMMKRERTAVVPQQAEQHPSAQLQRGEPSAEGKREMQGHAGSNWRTQGYCLFSVP